jgi:long-chain acyl-CoA synthetase
VISFAELDHLRARGREHAAVNPVALGEAEAQVGEDDLFTFIYTSGTTGPPKACMIRHRNYYEMAACVVNVPEFAISDDTMLLYLPMAHNFGRFMHLLGAHVGYTTAFVSDPLRVAEAMPAVRPTLLPSVPRLYEKVHTAVLGQFEEVSGPRKRLLDWALRVGREVSELRQRGEAVPAGLARKHRVADRLVYSKIKDRLGGRLRLGVSGGAPLAKEIAAFFHSLDILIIEGWGLTECTTAAAVNRPGRFRFGTVGPALPGFEVRIDEDGFISITDRKKDILITAGGKNVAPANLENALKTAPLVSQALVLGDRRPYIAALITVDPVVGDGLPPEQVHERVQAIVDDVNAGLSRFEQIKRFRVLPRDFSAEEGEVTPTLKLKRRVCEEHFAADIEALYA